MVDVPAYRRAAPVSALRQRLASLYEVEPRQVFLTSTGRAACRLFLRAVAGGAGDGEVALQSFTCVAAALPVAWEGLRPAWVDVDPATLSMSVAAFSRLAPDRLRAVVVQHSFGLAAPVDALVAIAHERGIPVLEDCAHALGVRDGSRMIGSAGDAALLSFGVEKTLRTKYGGALVVHDPELREAVEREYRRFGEVPVAVVVRWLLYPMVQRFLRLLPAPAIAPARRVMTHVGVLAEELTPSELAGGAPPQPPSRLPGVLCQLVLDELDSLDANLAHRAAVSDAYQEVLAGCAAVWTPTQRGAPLLRQPVVVGDEPARERVRRVLDAHGVSRSVWFEPAIFPRRTDTGRLGYDPATCPTAESLARRIVNLPTGRHVTTGWARSLAGELCAVLGGRARVPDRPGA